MEGRGRRGAQYSNSYRPEWMSTIIYERQRHHEALTSVRRLPHIQLQLQQLQHGRAQRLRVSLRPVHVGQTLRSRTCTMQSPRNKALRSPATSRAVCDVSTLATIRQSPPTRCPRIQP
jgi:hypothetical protein